jgi:hypothetical protein
MRKEAKRRIEVLAKDEYLKPYDPWEHIVIPSDDIAKDDLLVGTKWKTSLRYLRTVDPRRGEEVVLEFEMEFTDRKLSDEDIQKIQTSKTAKSLNLTDCRELRIKSRQIPISTACYTYSSEMGGSEMGEKLNQEGREHVISFLSLDLVLELKEDGVWIDDTIFPGPLVLFTTQHSMDTWTPGGEDSEQEVELTNILSSIVDEFKGMNEKIEESTNGFAKWGMRFQQVAMIPGIIEKGTESLVEFLINKFAMPTKEELELSSRRDVALRKQVDLTLGDKEVSMEIKAILD